VKGGKRQVRNKLVYVVLLLRRCSRETCYSLGLWLLELARTLLFPRNVPK